MPAILTQHSYGKSQVRFTKVTRHAEHHDLAEWSVDIELGGDFDASYTNGDNRKVVATDSMKNTVYVFARDSDLTNPEAFATSLATHFLKTYPQVSSANVRVVVSGWERIAVGGRPHPHAFAGRGPERRFVFTSHDRKQQRLVGGIEDLMLLKTTDSAFRDFVRDEFATLPDTDDRILATALTCEWQYRDSTTAHDAAFQLIRQTLLETFACHHSLAVQQTLYAMGSDVLEACIEVDSISLTMPNRHRILVNLAPLGRENANVIFVPTEAPFGLITGTLRRSL
ncbi:MAG: factor-independent urate hydroxylase [Gemmataceae bacterium]